MLIVNADDLGRNAIATDRIVACYSKKRINSASGMVFMEDSARAAALANECGMDVGLHINLTETFSAQSVSMSLRRDHERIRKFLRASKYALLIYNPFLKAAFEAVVQAQVDEFTRLYGRPPDRVDGHQHMHLCSNMVWDRLLPAGIKVRRSFSFFPGEKSIINRWYRACVDRRLSTRYRVTDYFFALSQHLGGSKLQRIVGLGRRTEVELMTHPEVDCEFKFLAGTEFASVREHASIGSPARCL